MTLSVTREAVLAYRRGVQHLDERLPAGEESLRRVTRAGVQDSMPRAALLSLHARVSGVEPTVLEDVSLVQIWGPRFNVYVVAHDDVAPFTLGRHPDGARRLRAERMAAEVARVVGAGELADREVGAALGVGNLLRYATTTGTVLIRWDGAPAPLIRVVAAPAMEPVAAQRELARRYLHVYGPATAESFARWAGVKPAAGQAAFAGIADELVPVRTPLGEALLLASDEPRLREAGGRAGTDVAAVRLLPSGDAFTLLWGADRELLVPQAVRRDQLWTPRVWPGAVLVGGEVVGTWRRAGTVLDVEPWRPFAARERDAVEAEAAALPLPGADPGSAARGVRVRWVG